MKKAIFMIVVCLIAVPGCKRQVQPLWTLKLKSRSYTTPIIHQGRFYVFSQAGEVICGDLKQGVPIWKQTLPDPILADPVLSRDGVLYLITQNGSLYALDSQTGGLRWQIKIPDSFIAPISLTESMILLPSETGTLYACSPNNGSGLWKFSGAVKFNAPAVVMNDRILIGGWAKQFYSLKLDGTVDWKMTVADRVTNPAVTTRNTVYFPSYDHFIYSVDLPSGKLLWRYPVKMSSNLVLQNDHIYLQSGKDLLRLSASSGKLLDRRPFGAIVNRLYPDPPDVLVLSSNLYRVDSNLKSASLVVRRPIYKLSSGEGMLLACDDLYSIYGYGNPVP